MYRELVAHLVTEGWWSSLKTWIAYAEYILPRLETVVPVAESANLSCQNLESESDCRENWRINIISKIWNWLVTRAFASL